MKASELEKRIQELPSGGLTKKTINGKTYTYYQWTEDKKQRAKVVKEQEAEYLAEKIAERKVLEEKLKGLPPDLQEDRTEAYIANVVVGEELIAASSIVAGLEKRNIYSELEAFVYSQPQDKVLILYGLRRTGKTTLIRQLIYSMTDEDRAKAAFIQVNRTNTLADLNKDLKLLWSRGFRYIFIDEVTLMDDFIEGAALFSDVYAPMGMKIVLSGTDSLSFLFSEDEQLYDRCIILHTTFIPFKEFKRLLKINDIDQYIKYGGTLSQSGENYNKSTFISKTKTDEYVNSAIANNIQHSLRNYQYEGHFRALWNLYEKKELTNAINRIVEDLNHRFTVDVLVKDFRSHDFGLAKKNLRRDRMEPTDILDSVDEGALTARLMDMLEIINKKRQSIEITEAHSLEIKEYLTLLDLVFEVPIITMPSGTKAERMHIVSQPGLRYSQAEALVKALLKDETFSSLSAVEKKSITERILQDVKGRILEELVLLEAAKAYPEKEVFKLKFGIGEIDAAIYDAEKLEIELFEIKHSSERHPEQYRHLADEDKLKDIEFKLGTIIRRTVLYRGETAKAENGIEYRNVEEFLCSIAK